MRFKAFFAILTMTVAMTVSIFAYSAFSQTAHVVVVDNHLPYVVGNRDVSGFCSGLAPTQAGVNGRSRKDGEILATNGTRPYFSYLLLSA